MREQSRDPQEVIRSFAEDLVRQWLTEGVVPDDAVEASTPELRTLFGAGLELSFDDFQHKHYVRPDWGFSQFSLPETFPAPFELYIPTSWQIERIADRPAANIVDESGVRRQLVQAATREPTMLAVERALDVGRLLGFEVARDYGPFLRWRFVAATETAYEVWSIFSSGEYALVCLGKASDATELKTQLESSVNSIPWYHWIEAQKASDA